MKNIALIIAGGLGERTHQDIPKQFINVNDVPVIIYTLIAFQKHPNIDSIVVACLEGWSDILNAYAKQFGITKLEAVVKGGETGQKSIVNGVDYIYQKYKSDDDIVLIHDAIRPLVSQDEISDNIRVCRRYGNATTVIPCTSAMLKTDDGMSSDSQISRDNLKITQTPQSFYIIELHEIHKSLYNANLKPAVSTCSLYVELGKKIYFSKGSEKNIKITTTEDLEIFSALLKSNKPRWIKE